MRIDLALNEANAALDEIFDGVQDRPNLLDAAKKVEVFLDAADRLWIGPLQSE